MVSKKEILKKQKSPYLHIDDNVIDGSIESVHDAMDEWAKIEAIEFLEWATERNLEISLGVFVDNEGTYESTEKYYELYLQQTNK